ncbi:UNVERIFIED_ORG: ppGpp synthetase/RelA/SpoT-type nucleotidyltransferase [Rahnella aquatilis]
MYDAWGDFVVAYICDELVNSKQRDIKSHLKQDAKHRVKEDNSLADKAFHRKEKSYSDPYNDIEDKVGARFVVLLAHDIDEICEIIKSSNVWDWKLSRHYEDEKNSSPMLFTYQSVHFIVTSNHEFSHKDIKIKKGTPCEIQIRTLLQHAYAELTHDAIYKTKTIVKPEIQRTVAKSMALIETTDDFFCAVSKALASEPDIYFNITEELDALYNDFIGITPEIQKSTLLILDTFRSLIDDKLIYNIKNLLSKSPEIAECIKYNSKRSVFYSQSIVLFVYWLIKRKKSQLEENWPLDWEIIQIMASDVGVSLDRKT